VHSLEGALELVTSADRVARGAPVEHAALYAIWERIDSRIQELDDDVDALNPRERAFHMLFFVLDGEVDNGGLEQFFFNSSGDNVEAVLDSLVSVGAERTLAVLRSAVEAFPGSVVPRDIEKRREALASDRSKLPANLDALTKDYYGVRGELYPLLMRLVLEHRSDFALPDVPKSSASSRKRGQ